MHYNSDVPNFRFSETQKPASVIPFPGSAGEIHSNNAEVLVSVWNRNRRSSESQGNYSASIGVEMIDLELWGVKIEVDCQRSDDSWDVIQGDGDQIFHFKTDRHSLDILRSVSLTSYLLGSYRIGITSVDLTGNPTHIEKEEAGLLASMASSFMEIFEDTWDTIVEKVKDLKEIILWYMKLNIVIQLNMYALLWENLMINSIKISLKMSQMWNQFIGHCIALDAMYGSTLFIPLWSILAIPIGTMARNDETLMTGDSWAAHFYLGCSLHRKGADYYSTLKIAEGWEWLEDNHPSFNQGYSKEDVSATMWGWVRYKEYGLSTSSRDTAKLQTFRHENGLFIKYKGDYIVDPQYNTTYIPDWDED